MNAAVQQQTFLALTRNSADLEWLQGALSSLGQVLQAGRGSLDELLALIDVTSAGLLFVGLDRDNLVSQSALIEGVLEAKPLMAVVALGDGLDNQLVLSAMRAGARDFVAYGSRTSEVTGLVRHLNKRMPNMAPARNGGRLSVLFSRQQDADAALLAAHLALASEEAGRHTLLLDLGQIQGDALAVLGLEASFHFGDALRNLRRLDASLIDSAFCEAPGGMRILALAAKDAPLEQCSAAELYLLIGSLRQYFEHIVLNLSGQADSEALRLLVGTADNLLWCADQSVPNCQRNLQMLARWREMGMKLGHVSLLLDRYMGEVAPSDKVLGETFDLSVIEVLPPASALRMTAKNLGRSLFELAPREHLCQRLRQLGAQLAGVEVAPRRWPWPWSART
jgi:pilus assembly protein CpaE